MTFWSDKRILLTGGAGFLGSFVVEKLQERGCKEIFVTRSKDYDLIAKLTQFKGHIIWDNSKPDGQPRRMLDIIRAEQEFGFKAKTDLEEGLRKTIEWYINQHDKKA